MLPLQRRAMRFVDRLILCVVAVPLLVLASRWARADEECPGTQAKRVACKNSATAECTSYNPDNTGANCKDKTYTVVFFGNFAWEYESTKTKMAIQSANGNEAVFKDCSKTYNCDWSADVGCAKGNQKGDTATELVYETKDCPKKQPEPTPVDPPSPQ